MDPNNDGWITTSGLTFTTGQHETKRVLNWTFVAMPIIKYDPTSDLDTGSSCRATENRFRLKYVLIGVPIMPLQTI